MLNRKNRISLFFWESPDFYTWLFRFSFIGGWQVWSKKRSKFMKTVRNMKWMHITGFCGYLSEFGLIHHEHKRNFTVQETLISRRNLRFTFKTVYHFYGAYCCHKKLKPVLRCLYHSLLLTHHQGKFNWVLFKHSVAYNNIGTVPLCFVKWLKWMRLYFWWITGP